MIKCLVSVGKTCSEEWPTVAVIAAPITSGEKKQQVNLSSMRQGTLSTSQQEVVMLIGFHCSESLGLKNPIVNQ